jgi:hypothetical protein
MYGLENSFIYSFDIETANNKDLGEDGLDPRRSRVTSVSVSSEYRNWVFDDSNEVTLLTSLSKLITSLTPGLLVTWNGSAFDLPFLHDRHNINALSNPISLRASSRPTKYAPIGGHTCGYHADGPLWGRHSHADIQWAWENKAKEMGVKWSLKPLAEALGFNPVVEDAANLHLLSPEARARYNLSDAQMTRRLALYRSIDLKSWTDS